MFFQVWPNKAVSSYSPGGMGVAVAGAEGELKNSYHKCVFHFLSIVTLRCGKFIPLEASWQLQEANEKWVKLLYSSTINLVQSYQSEQESRSTGW